MASNIDMIDVLPPGIYEAVLTPRKADDAGQELIAGEWITRFEHRTLDDIRAIVQPDAENDTQFAAVRGVSDVNLSLYRLLVQPFIQAFTSEQSAEWLRKLNPYTLPYELFSDRNPFMEQIAKLAEEVRQDRRPVQPDNPLVRMQAIVSETVIALLNGWRDMRDRGLEQVFLAVYGSPLLQSLVGLGASDESPRRRPGMEPEQIEFIKARIAELKDRLGEGGLVEAFVRSLVYIRMVGQGVDERNFRALRRLRARYDKITLKEYKDLVRKQFFALLLDQNAAMAAIPSMLPDDRDKRAEVLDVIRELVPAAGKITDEQARRLEEVERLFGADRHQGKKKKRKA